MAAVSIADNTNSLSGVFTPGSWLKSYSLRILKFLHTYGAHGLRDVMILIRFRASVSRRVSSPHLLITSSCNKAGDCSKVVALYDYTLAFQD
jgi:hypothetical protein